MSIEEQIQGLIKAELQSAIGPVLSELKKQSELLEEINKPYKHVSEHLSLKQAMEYTGRSRSCIEAWVNEGLLKPYKIGISTSKYYSKSELDTIKARWQAIINKQGPKPPRAV